jgi:hypothetical protein
VFGYGAASERAAIADLGLPAPEALSPIELAVRYRQAGFTVEVRPIALEAVAALRVFLFALSIRLGQAQQHGRALGQRASWFEGGFAATSP